MVLWSGETVAARVEVLGHRDHPRWSFSRRGLLSHQRSRRQAENREQALHVFLVLFKLYGRSPLRQFFESQSDGR